MFPSNRDINLDEITKRCVMCGRCQAVCPVYASSSTEDNCARGKIRLIEKIKNNEYDFDDYIKGAINRCVACSACQDACKNDVNYIDLIAAGREMMNESAGEPLIKKLALSRFAERDETEQISRYGSVINKIFNRKDGAGSGIRLKFPIPGVGDGMYIPPLAESAFQEKQGGTHGAKNEWMRVVFFVGCSLSFILPEIAESILEFLVSSGITVIVPPDQVCCGTPHYLSGEPDTANRLLWKNRDAFAEYKADAVITGCPTCGGGLKDYYDLKDKDGKHLPVYDFVEFISKYRRKLKLPELSGDGKYTWHDPCHLYRLQKIKDEPREILRNLLSDRFVEMEKPASCCGFGGVFAASNIPTALDIAKKKSDRIKQSGAVTVVTACPGCVLFLRIGAAANTGTYNVIHLSQLLNSKFKI